MISNKKDLNSNVVNMIKSVMFLLLVIIPKESVAAQPLWVLPTEASDEVHAIYRAQRNYTRLKTIEGYECEGYIDDVNSTVKKDDLKIWRVRFQKALEDLGREGFECSPMTWVAEVLNCDEDNPDDDLICENGHQRAPTETAFSGRGGCLTLVAAMNYMHGEGREEWDEFCSSRNSTRHIADGNAYPKSCAGPWRSCPYNVHFSGYLSPSFINFDDRRFHLHAHNIQGNRKGWQGCTDGNYVSTGKWPRYIRTTYQSSNLVSIYEGGSMQKCAEQNAWYVHVRGNMMGSFKISQRTTRRSTHTCYSPYSCGGAYCYDSDNDDCLVDFDTLKNDDWMCGPLQDGPRTVQDKNAWCCGEGCEFDEEIA